MEDPCPFCEINTGRAPATFVHEWSDAFAIVPLNPVVEGHVLVIPKTHVEDFTTDPEVTAKTYRRAAELGRDLQLQHANAITSKGEHATQSVFHLHVHLVPRTKNDGLALPWYSGKSKKAKPEQEPCGDYPPEIVRDDEGREWETGDCWCTLPKGHEGKHFCGPCTKRHGMPGWSE